MLSVPFSQSSGSIHPNAAGRTAALVRTDSWGGLTVRLLATWYSSAFEARMLATLHTHRSQIGCLMPVSRCVTADSLTQS